MVQDLASRTGRDHLKVRKRSGTAQDYEAATFELQPLDLESKSLKSILSQFDWAELL